ncbi:DUF2797 domain-containing protein [Vibrio aestuarianus]|uniref:DUF2797 domain-containing protein n=1 Tax=Vibrio aestuarianus TaxID=28171 RepID=UPI0023EE4C14|nr:DUF2797 domain-containing protein [Vibrio aestuarianus]
MGHYINISAFKSQQYLKRKSKPSYTKASKRKFLGRIKGQYLLFDTGVINIRKFTSYEVEVSN